MGTYEGRIQGKGRRVALACARANDVLTERLLAGAWDALFRHGVTEDAVDVVWVPGPWDLPLVAQRLAATGRYHAIVALGVVVGEPGQPAIEHEARPCSSGLQQAALDAGIPVVPGLVVVASFDKGLATLGTTASNAGAAAVLSALEMVDVLDQLPEEAADAGEVVAVERSVAWGARP